MIQSEVNSHWRRKNDFNSRQSQQAKQSLCEIYEAKITNIEESKQGNRFRIVLIFKKHHEFEV